MSGPPPANLRFSRHSPGLMLKPLALSMASTWPSAPLRISSIALRLVGSYWHRYAIISFLLAALQASIMARESATLVAIGFSQRTCLPALAERIVYSACMLLGSATYTASIAL